MLRSYAVKSAGELQLQAPLPSSHPFAKAMAEAASKGAWLDFSFGGIIVTLEDLEVDFHLNRWRSTAESIEDDRICPGNTAAAASKKRPRGGVMDQNDCSDRIFVTQLERRVTRFECKTLFVLSFWVCLRSIGVSWALLYPAISFILLCR